MAMDDDDDDDDGGERIQEDNPTLLTTPRKARELRASLRQSYPEIDELYSNHYVADVLRVPDRAYDYARDEKIKGALDWRRGYGVEGLTKAFVYDEIRGVLNVVVVVTQHHERADTRDEDEDEDADSDENDIIISPPPQRFIPSQYLIDACRSHAFVFAGFDENGRGILRANSRVNWWRTGVEDGIRYHVLVIEHALRALSDRNERIRDDDGKSDDEPTSESLILTVDTSNLPLVPPPPSVFTEMASLMQKAYPDRIHRIYIGPVNGVLRRLYEMVKPYLRPRSREKIVLLDRAPNLQEMQHMI